MQGVINVKLLMDNTKCTTTRTNEKEDHKLITHPRDKTKF